jgi:hypothetical protein
MTCEDMDVPATRMALALPAGGRSETSSIAIGRKQSSVRLQ